MALKFKLVSELAKETAGKVTADAEGWKRFLNTASRMYRYSFEDQLLIYAQRPGATACADVDTWNEKMFRWIRRGACGIALIHQNKSGWPHLDYVFDIKDTRPVRGARDVKLWEIRPEQHEYLMQALKEKYGKGFDYGNLTDVIGDVAQALVYERYQDCVNDFLNSSGNTQRELHSEAEWKALFRRQMLASVRYTLYARCGIDVGNVLDEDLSGITAFASPKALHHLGNAVSSISGEILVEIRNALRAYERAEREKEKIPIDNSKVIGYTEIRREFNTVKRESETGIKAEEKAETGTKTDAEIIGKNEDKQGGGEESTTKETRPEEETVTHTVTENRNKEERGMDDGRTDLHEGRGLSDTGPEVGRGGRDGGNAPGQIRTDEERLSEGTPQRDIHLDAPDGRAAGAPDGDRQAGAGAGGQDRGGHDEAKRRGREPEGKGPDGVGAGGEQLHGTGEGAGDHGHRLRIDQEQNSTEEQTAGAEPAVSSSAGKVSDTDAAQLSLFPTQFEQIASIVKQREELARESVPFPNLSVPDTVIDRALTSGGNEQKTIQRIVSFFQKPFYGMTAGEFLQKEYGTGGKGLTIAGRKYALWFNEEGIRIAPGKTVETTLAVTVPWPEAAERISRLLENGTFATQEILDAASEYEKGNIAEKLWFLVQDMSKEAEEGGFLPHLSKIYHEHAGFPEGTKKYAELLDNMQERDSFRAEVSAFMEAYRSGRKLLRFRPQGMDHLEERIRRLGIPARDFKAVEGFAPQRGSFITEDEFNALLTKGSGISHGKMRIASFFLQGHDNREKEAFLRYEYGIGGFGYTGYNEMHDGKGIKFTRGDDCTGFDGYETVLLKWPKVRRRIDGLLQYKKYLNAKETEYMPEYEKQQLALSLYSFYFYAPNTPEADRRNGWQPEKKVKEYRQLLDSMEYSWMLYEDMMTYFPAIPEDNRYYDMLKRAVTDMGKYVRGEYGLFKPLSAAELAEEREKRKITAQKRKRGAEPEDEAEESEEYEESDGSAPAGRKATKGSADREKAGQPAGENAEPVGELEAAARRLAQARQQKEKLREKAAIDGQLSIFDLFGTGETETQSVATHETADLEEAKHLIENFLFHEYGGGGADFGNPEHIEVAYTITEDRQHEIQVEVNLVNYSMNTYVDGACVDTRTYGSMRDLIDQELSVLSFDDLVSMDHFPDALQEDRTAEVSEQEPAEINPEQEQGKEISDREQGYTEQAGHTQEVMAEIQTGEPQEEVAAEIHAEEPQEEAAAEIHTEEPQEDIATGDIRSEEQETLAPAIPTADIDGGKLYTTETTAVYSKELPFEVVLQKLRFNDPVTPQPPAQRKADKENLSNFHITDEALGEGGQKSKYAANVAAIRTLKTIEAENRLATHKEQAILSRYVGWGGLSPAFDVHNGKWAKEYAELKELLTPKEYESARGTTPNAFYTSPTVINAIYEAVGNMDFTPGNILEPSCGVGNFFGLLPEKLQNSALYGVELDSVTGRIATQLYQRADITISGFQKTDYPDDFFDLAVGNVPFGEYKVHDRKYDRQNLLIHDYFLVKTLDKVRPGGIMAFVTSKGTMDKADSRAREALAMKADLLGAVRLPNNAFSATAGTGVTADILFFQKRGSAPEKMPEWVHTGKTEDGVPLNLYYLSHPEMVLGKMSFWQNMYGNKTETACLPLEGADLKAQLSEAVKRIGRPDLELLHMDAPVRDGLEDEESIPADPGVRNFSYTERDGKLYFRENSRMKLEKPNRMAAERIKGMIAIRDSTRRLIRLQTDGYGDDEIRKEQANLNRLYDSFSKKYGLLNSAGNRLAFRQDSSYPLLCSLEILDEEGRFKAKADMFTKRTIQHRQPVTKVDTAVEALGVSIGERACIDLGFMASLMGGTEKIPQIVSDLKGIIFRDPAAGPFLFPEKKNDGRMDNTEDERSESTNLSENDGHEAWTEVTGADGMEHFAGDGTESEGNTETAWQKGWQTADEYLSGNVRKKLEAARKAAEEYPEFAVNVEALEKVQPKNLTAPEISVRIGAPWIDTKYYKQFMFELFRTPGRLQDKGIDILYTDTTGEWRVTGKSADSTTNTRVWNTYGTKRINAYEIMEHCLNQRSVQIFDTLLDDEGREHRVLNEKQTAIAQQKQDAIREAFQNWIFSDPDRRTDLCATYNRLFNATRPREYDGQHINFNGMNPEIRLETHQRNAVARILYGGNTLLAHVVGAGKTFEMAAAAMESKRLGLCRKSMFVVPNHLTEQWGAEFLNLYPGANILVATKKDFEPKNRRKFCARIATGDYDAVIIGHSQFEKLPISPERQEAVIQEELDEIMDAIEEAKLAKEERFTVKQMERTKKSLEAKLQKLHDKKKDDTINFEELGIDRLFVDEAHMFKNLYLFTKMRNVAGISQTDAQKSSDMFAKCRYMDEITGGRGVVFATGTPVSNSMTELYTMMRYLQYRMLEEGFVDSRGNLHSLKHFDNWAATFGEQVTAVELKPEGTGFRLKTRFARFYNLPELMNLWKEAADIQTADMLKLPVPEAEYVTIQTEPSAAQKKMVQGLAERAEKIRREKIDPRKDNMLKITSDGRKLALDQRILNPLLPDDPGSKVNACVNKVFEIWQETALTKGTQLIFSDLSTPKGRAEKDETEKKDGQGKETVPENSEKAGTERELGADTEGTATDGHTMNGGSVEMESSDTNGVISGEPLMAENGTNPSEQAQDTPDEEAMTESVYEDIRDKLIRKGIPTQEIAFIHSAKTEVQKAELFAKVRNGQIRVLLGSTQKMGAGTNVQTKLVATHDLDCPWRPADLEQRAGRIVRRGNENDHVRIFRYVTKGTFDAYTWGVVENKQKFIGQVMTSKSPARSIEDVDATALSYAEVKMLATGDMRIKEKMDLDIQVTKLKMLKANHTAQQYEMQDRVRGYYPNKIKETQLYIDCLKADIPMLTAHPTEDDKFHMTVMETEYVERKEAGKAIIAACRLLDDPDKEIELGEYRGFPMRLAFDGQKFKVTMKQHLTYTAELSEDALGNTVRIDNALEKIPQMLKNHEENLVRLNRELESAREEAERPFPQEQELAEKSARLSELNTALNEVEKEENAEQDGKTDQNEKASPNEEAGQNEQAGQNGKEHGVVAYIPQGERQQCVAESSHYVAGGGDRAGGSAPLNRAVSTPNVSARDVAGAKQAAGDKPSIIQSIREYVPPARAQHTTPEGRTDRGR